MNDKNREEAYKATWQNVKLSDRARIRIAENLAQYVTFHSVSESVRNQDMGRSIERVPQGDLSGTSFFRHFRFNTMTAFILIAVLVGGGTSFAAENALPGDLLYPVKVTVNEEVRGAFALSSEAEARLQARLVEERLEEAEKLAAEGRLTAEVAVEIEARMKQHAEEAREESNEVETEGNVETAEMVRADLSATLEAYERILTKFTATATNTGASSLIIEVANEREATAEARGTTTIDLDVRTDILEVDSESNNSIEISDPDNEGSPRSDEHEPTTNIDLEADVNLDTTILETTNKSELDVRSSNGIGI